LVFVVEFYELVG